MKRKKTFQNRIPRSTDGIFLKCLICTAIISLHLFIWQGLSFAGTTTYDFTSGAGSNKWGYELEVSASPPSTNDTPSSTTMTYSNISSDNSTYEQAYIKNGNYAAQRFKFTISENRTGVTQIDVLWNGMADRKLGTEGGRLYIWNFDSGSYSLLNSSSVDTDVNITGTITSTPANYIDTDGILYLILITNQSSSTNKEAMVDTDYVKVDITSNSEPSATINSAAQQTDGSQTVLISVEAGDPENSDSRLSVYYGLSAGTCTNKATMTGTATADVTPVPDVTTANVYQVGDDTPIKTSSTNTVTFYWDAGTDLPNTSGTYYIKITINDGQLDQSTPPTTSLTIDNVNPSNPTAPAGAWRTASKTDGITNDSWQSDDDTPYFEWSGASDTGSSVAGYSIYWGNSASGEPGTSQEQVGTSYGEISSTGDGTFYLRARTFDSYGNYTSALTLFTFKYDNTAPSNPTAPASAWRTTGKTNAITNDTWQNDDNDPYFEWTGSSDGSGSGIAGYSLYWGMDSGGEPGTSQEQSGSSYEISTPVSSGTYYLRVRTFDTAGAYSSPSTIFTFKYDAAAPTNPTAPASAWDSSFKTTVILNNTAQNDDQTPYFEWSGAADSGSGVSGYSIYWGTSSSGEPGTSQEQVGASYDVGSATGETTYYLRVRTFDTLGNYSDPVTLFTFIYDNTKPTVTITITPNPTGVIVIGALEFELVFSESMNTGTSPTVSYDPAGATGAQTVSTSGAWSTTTYTNDIYTVYNDSAVTSGTGDGEAAISVSVAQDVAGNTMDADTNDTFAIDSAIHHFLISHDGSGLINIAETVTITAKTQGGDTVLDYTDQITLNTIGESGQITWALDTGSGTFNDNGTDDDSATYTFVSGDNGVVVLTMTSTDADTLDMEVTDSTYIDDDTEGNIIISSYALDHFVISHDNAGVAGTGEIVTVTAINTESATKTDYVGTITLDTSGTATTIAWGLSSGQGIFNDGGGNADTATYTFNINDQGQVSFTFTDTKVETVDIDCADGTDTDDDSESNMVVGPGVLDNFDVIHDNAATAGVAEQVTIQAYDAYKNIKVNYTGTITLDTDGSTNDIAWALDMGNGFFNDGGAGVDTATYTFNGSDDVESVFTITDDKAESIDIDVSGDGESDLDEEGNLVVGANAINYFVVDHDGAADAGISENVGVTAYDQYGNIKDDYTGTIILDTNGTTTTISWALISGNGLFNDGGASVDTATYTFNSADSGTAIFSARDTTAETFDIDISGDGQTDDDTEGNLVVGPAVLSYFVLSHDGSGNAGVAEDVTITVKDSVGDTKTDYTGQISLDTNGTAATISWENVNGNGTFNDGGASVDTALYTYDSRDNGVVTLSVNDTTQETINISVSAAGKSDDDTEGNLVIGVPLLSHFEISHYGAALAGTAENIIVTAVDTTDSTKIGYTGQITLDTTGTVTTITWANVNGSGTFADGGASVDTATYTYASGDNGAVTLSLTDTLVELLNISVSGDSKSDNDTEGNLIVGPGTLDHFRISHDGFGTVNIAESLMIQARDANENIKTDYTGQITVDTNGTTSTITWALQSGAGTFNDGGTSVDTATYTYDSSDSGVVILRLTDAAAETLNISVSGDSQNDDDVEGNLLINPSGLQNTGTTSPTANAGTWGSGANAYADDSANATASTGNIQTYYDYGFSLPYNSIILGLISRIDAWWDGGGAVPRTPTASVELSWDGDSSYTTTGNVTPTLPTSQTTYNFGSSSDLWGRSFWSVDELNNTNFRTRITASGTASKTRRLDWIPVTVYYSIGASAVANNVTTDNVGPGSTGNLILDLTVTNSHTSSDTVTAIQVDNVGTASDSEITSVKLYYDSNNSDDYTAGVDTQIGSGTFSSGSKFFTGLSVSVAADGGTERFFAVLDVASDADDGGTLDARIPADGITLTTTGTIEPSALNSSGTREIAVTLDHFAISHDSNAVAGSDESITITAEDANDNTMTGYTGTINLDTSGTATTVTWGLSSGNGTFNDDGANVDTADYTFVASDNGVVTLTLNDTKAETLNISITGDATDDNEEEDLTIAPGPVDHFVISHDGTATAGSPETISVTVEDQYDNVLTDYANQITLDTNGTASTVTWALSSGYGSFAEDGASVDTATYTYSTSDNGVATFTVTDTTSETINITVAGDGKSDDNTEGSLVVSPSGLDYFEITHDGDADAGTAESITITAIDTLDNTKTDYSGTITLDTNGTVTTIAWANVNGNGTFNDGGASVDTATYTFDASDNGVVTLSITDTKTETINISVSGDTKSDDNTEGDLAINPGAIDHFIVGHDGTGVPGISENITVTAYDVNDNIKTDYAGMITLDTNGTATTISWNLISGNGSLVDDGANVDTATYTYNTSDNGAATFGMVDYTAETIDIDVSGSSKTDDDSEGSMEIISSGIDHFEISHDGTSIVNAAESIAIYAKDANGDTITTYQGQIILDTTGTASAITWGLVTGNGMFADGGGSVDTATYTYNASDSGAVVLSLTDTTEETINISVSGEGKTDDDTEGSLVINPGGIHHYHIIHDNTAQAGVAETVTIRVHDANHDVVTSFTGSITVDTDGTATAITWAKQTGNGSFSDGGASVDTATYTYVASDNGEVILTLTDTKVETINIFVSGSGKTDSDVEGDIVVSPGSIDYFVVTHDGAAVVGVADNVTVVARDAYDNVLTDYTGQVTLDTNGTATTITWAKVSGNGSFLDGGGSVDTATYTYASSDNGSTTLSLNDTTAETLNIIVTGDSKSDDDSEGSLIVSPTSINYFAISHDNNAEAGVADNVTVTAYDSYDNIKDDYQGEITLDSSGTASAITWALQTGNGTFNDGGASVDTATYTYNDSDDGVAVFTIADTKTESIDIDVSGDSRTDTDAEGNLIVGPTSLDYFTISHDGTAQAGVADNVSITAYDTYSNIKTDHTGQISLDTDGTATTIIWANSTGVGSFSDGGASVDTATYTYVSGDNGAVTLTITDTTVETLDISVSGSGQLDDNTHGALSVGPGGIDYFIITHDSSAIQSVAEEISVTAYDAYDNTKTNYSGTIALSVTGETGEITWALVTGSGTFSDDGASVDTASYQYNSSDNGAVVLTITDDEADTLNMVVSGDGKSDDDAEGNLIFTASSVTADGIANAVTTASVSAGATDVLILDITVTNNNILAGDTITAVTVDNAGTASDSEISSVEIYYDSNNSGVFESGVDTQAGTGTFSSGTKTFSGLSISLTAGGNERIFAVLDVSSSINDGDTLDVSIPSNGITLTSAPTIEDTTLNSAGTRAIVLSLDHFVISHDTSATAGVSDNITVTAKDSNENTLTSYTGTIALDTNATATAITWALLSGNGTFEDGGASADTASYTFAAADNGTATFTIADTKAESVNISVSGDTKSDDDTEGNLVVAANSLDHFVLSHGAAAIAGTADNVTVTAKDIYENTVDNYTGQITLDTNGTATAITWALDTGFGTFNDGGASVDTATYTYSISDNSTAVLTITDTKAETLNISVSGDSKSDDNTEGNLVVSPNNLDHFVLSHDNAAQAGVTENVTVTATDAYENTITDYTGSITVDTDGTATTIAWAKVTGDGTFNDGGIEVDTATYSFAESDNGVAVLSLADTTLENLNISVSGNGKTDDDNEGTLNVGAGLIDYFAITHDGLATQNQAENIIIKAYDAYGNVKDDYTGQITVDTNGTANSITWVLVTGDGTFNDGGASVDTATYMYTGSDNGEVTLSLTDTTAELINISVSGDSKTDDDNEGVLEIVAVGFHHFKITHDGDAVVNVAEQITITAKDASDGTVTNFVGTVTVDTNGTTTAITWTLDTGNGTFNDGGASVDTATYEFVAGDNGVAVLTLADSSEETININVSGGGKTDDNTEGSLVVNPSGIDHFLISLDGSGVAGTAENIVITANDANSSALTDYVGTITLDTTGTAGTITWANSDGNGTFNDGGAAVDTATYTFDGDDNGTVTLTLTDTRAETFNISVSGDSKTDDNSEGDLAITPDTIDHFVISHDSEAEAGVAEDVSVTAKDNYDNTITDYTGQIIADTNGTATAITWALSTGDGTFNDDGASVDTSTYTYAASDNGVVVLNLTDTASETVDIAITGDGQSDDNTEGNLVVGSGAINKFVISHDGNATAGDAENVSVTAYDIYNNIKTNYTGTITIDSNGTANAITWALSSGYGTFLDGGASVDTATYTFVSVDNGVATFTITDTNAETIDIDVSGSGKFDDDMEGNLVVSAGGLFDFLISHDGDAYAGTAENIIIYAKDTNGNTLTDYTGQITIDTNGTADTITWANVDGSGTFAEGGASVDTATYTYVSGDNGAVTLSVNDTTTEAINISVSGDSKYDDDSESNLTINPGTLNYFVISHDNAAIQSVAEPITITAKDSYGNDKIDYSGTVTLDTNGTPASITWALNTGNGTFVDGGASVDTATYTFLTQDSGVAIFDITNSTAETLNIAVNDGGTTDDDTEGNLVIEAATTTVDGTANVLSSYYTAQSETDLLVLNVTLTNNDVITADTIQSITIENSGSIPDNQISSVKLYYDSNNSGDYTSGTDSQVESSTFSSGTVTFSDIAINIADAGSELIFVTVNLAASVTDASTVDVRIPVNGLTFANSPNIPDTILNSSGTLTVDSGIPTDVTGLTSSSHNSAISSWSDPQSKDNTITVGWTPANDSGSGVDGYSVYWDTSPATLPDAVKDIEESATSRTSSTLPDGVSYYFHIRSVDNVGNWDTTTQHIGPFYIDTTGPDSTSIYQITKFAGGDYLYVSGNTIYYSGEGFSAFRVYVEAADALSGLKEAFFPSTVSTGGTDATEEGGAYEYVYTYEVSSSGSTYNNANISIYDLAGNVTTVPFNVILDNTPPNNVSNLSSSTHTPNVPSSNDDLTVTWSDVDDSQTGLAGYSVIVDTTSDTVPPKYKNVNSGVQTHSEQDLSNGTYYVHIRSVDNVGNWSSSATHAGPYIIGRGLLSASLSTSQSVISTGQSFTVTMTAQNTGSSTVNTVDPSTLTVNATGGAGANTSTNPGPQDIDTSAQAQFQWIYTAGSSSGTLNFQGYAQGVDQEGTITSNVAKSPDIYVEDKANLSLGISASPSTVNVSQTINIVITLTNTGTADAFNVIPSITPSGSAGPTIDTGPSPSSATIRGGKSQQFSFTAHATTDGTAVFTGDLSSGIDENSNLSLSVTSAQDSVSVLSPPSYAMTSSITATPTAVNTANTITVTMTVQNTGGSMLSNVIPSTLTIGGTSSDASLSTGPTPGSVSSLSAGSSQNFVWTYTSGTTLGTINFTGNASATQSSSTSSSSNDITLQAAAAALSSSIAVSPSAVLTNATITVTMTVNNIATSGGASATSVSPSILTLSGTSGEANLLTGPTPGSATIAAGSAQNFVWTYQAGTTAGTINFTGNATGTDGNSSADVSSTSTASSNVTISTLSADWTYPVGTNSLGPIRSIPVAYFGMNDYIYFGSDDNNMYVINGITHELNSSYVTSGDIRGLPYPSTELKSGALTDIVYFGTLGKTVYGLWADNSLRFERVLGEELSTAVLFDYVSNIYFGTTNSNVYCILNTDGSDVWTDTSTVGGDIESSPAMIYVPSIDYDEVYFGANDGKIYGFKAADGTGARFFDTGYGSEGAIKTAPYIALQDPSNPGTSRRLVLFGTENGRFYAVNTANLGAATDDTGWTTNPVVTGGAIYSAPWVDIDSGYVYFGCQDGKLYALSMTDGTPKENFPVDIGSPIDSWPLVYNGYVYFGADNGKIYAVDIDTGAIVPGWPYNTGSPVKSGASQHTIYDGEYNIIDVYIIIGSDSGKLYSFKAIE